MRNIFRRKIKLEADIAKMENKLREVMQPVSPRLEFVVDLRTRLLKSGLEFSPIQKAQQKANRWLLVSGVVGSILVLITSIRGLVALYGVINLLVQRIKSNTLTREAAPAT